MPLVATAVCPHPPLLIPEVAAGAAAELDDLRLACATAIARLGEGGAESVIVVGTGAGEVSRHSPAIASLAEFGVATTVTHDRAVAVAAQPLALSLSVASWLLRDVDLPIVLRSVPADLALEQCLALDLEVIASQPWALLVMGDGSACRGQKAPGYDDPRAEAFDASVAAALSSADPEALCALDPVLARELGCVGRAPWQVLAGAVLASPAGPGWRGELLYDAAPYGVAYFVASWTLAR